jgi:hypothetical protein
VKETIIEMAEEFEMEAEGHKASLVRYIEQLKLEYQGQSLSPTEQDPH